MKKNQFEYPAKIVFKRGIKKTIRNISICILLCFVSYAGINDTFGPTPLYIRVISYAIPLIVVYLVIIIIWSELLKKYYVIVDEQRVIYNSLFRKKTFYWVDVISWSYTKLASENYITFQTRQSVNEYNNSTLLYKIFVKNNNTAFGINLDMCQNPDRATVLKIIEEILLYHGWSRTN
ncbi:MAG TPA: hypothetical protein P5123_03985 [Spirochaetota bacterium]|nr:hypothetical protein [Spirochaetota bacterium]